jgi:hypothetical protein
VVSRRTSEDEVAMRSKCVEDLRTQHDLADAYYIDPLSKTAPRRGLTRYQYDTRYLDSSRQQTSRLRQLALMSSPAGPSVELPIPRVEHVAHKGPVACAQDRVARSAMSARVRLDVMPLVLVRGHSRRRDAEGRAKR